MSDWYKDPRAYVDDLIAFVAGKRDPDIRLKPLLTPARRALAIDHQIDPEMSALWIENQKVRTT